MLKKVNILLKTRYLDIYLHFAHRLIYNVLNFMKPLPLILRKICENNNEVEKVDVIRQICSLMTLAALRC